MEAAAATRKRANERQLTKDDDGAGDSDGEEGRAFNGENGAVETAGFNVASAEVLATRRIVKAGRRAAPVMAPPAAAAASAPVAPVVVLEAPVLKPVAPIMAATGGVSPFASFATAAQQPAVTKGEEADGEKEEDKGDAAAKEKKKLEDGTAEAGASPAPPPLASGGFGGFAAAASTGGGGTSGGFGSSGFGAGGFGGFSLAGAATAGGGFGSVAAETGAGAGVGISTADGFAAPPTLFGSQSNGTAAANGHDSPQAEVTLHREMVKTGEEDECSLFYYSEAKLFEFNNEKGMFVGVDAVYTVCFCMHACERVCACVYMCTAAERDELRCLYDETHVSHVVDVRVWGGACRCVARARGRRDQNQEAITKNDGE